MRIGFVTQTLVREHGQGRVNYEFAESLLSGGHSITVFSETISPALKSQHRVTWHRVNSRGWPTQLIRDQIFAVSSAKQILRHRRSIDMLVVNGFITWCRSDINLVHFVHSAWLRSRAHPIRTEKGLVALYRYAYTYLNSIFEQWAFRRAGTLIAVSEQVRREILALGVPEERVAVIHNGVDLERFCPAAPQRRQFGIPDDVFVVAFAGDLKTSRKNFDAVLNVAAALPDIHIVVAGDVAGSPYPEIAARLGLTDRVHFLGLRKDIEVVMQAADIFVFPSRYEPFGLVLLEASACGLPVVTTQAAGACEILPDDGCIVLPDPDDVEGLIAAVSALRDDRALCRRMAQSARSNAEKFSWEHARRQFQDLLMECAACS